jgi:hypothetical protein
VIQVSLTSSVVTFYYTIKVIQANYALNALLALSPFVDVFIISSLVCDVLITVTIIWVVSHIVVVDNCSHHLQLHHRRTGFKRTNDLITRIIILSVETGTVTTFFAAVDLILWLTTRSYSTIHFITHVPSLSGCIWLSHATRFLVLGKLYSNTLMANLNSRGRIGGIDTSNGVLSVPSTWEGSRSRTQINARGAVSGIQITETTEMNTSDPHEMVVRLCKSTGWLL